MTIPSKIHTLTLSRRGMFGAAALVAGAGLLAVAAAPRAQVAQKTVSYQDKPKGRARCDVCTQWQPPSSCKTVAGTISPSGWCTIFAPKS